jgi:hypothetical protein
MGKFSVKITIEIVVKAIMRIGTLSSKFKLWFQHLLDFLQLLKLLPNVVTITACLILN